MLAIQKKFSTIIVHNGTEADWRAASTIARELTTDRNSCMILNVMRADDIADIVKEIAYNDNLTHSFATYLAELLWEGFAGDDDEDKEPSTVEIDLAFPDSTEHFTVDLAIPVVYHTLDCKEE
jgi:hypothetical protein